MPPVATLPTAPEDDVAATTPPDGELRQPPAAVDTATIPAGVHVSIVSLLVNDVRHIAVPSPTRSSETLKCRLF